MEAEFLDLPSRVYFDSYFLQFQTEDNDNYKNDKIVIDCFDFLGKRIEKEYNEIHKTTNLDYLLAVLCITIIGIPFYIFHKILQHANYPKLQAEAIKKIVSGWKDYQPELRKNGYEIKFEVNKIKYRNCYIDNSYSFKIIQQGQNPEFQFKNPNNEFIGKCLERYRNNPVNQELQTAQEGDKSNPIIVHHLLPIATVRNNKSNVNLKTERIYKEQTIQQYEMVSSSPVGTM